MKWIALWLGGALWVATAGTCMAAPMADWTVMVFMNGDNNLEGDALIDFAEMARVGSSDRVKVVVQLDRIGDQTLWLPHFWTRTHRFLITKDMVPDPTSGVTGPDPALAITGHDGLDDVDGGEVNMGDPAALVNFIQWARQAYPAQRYFLIIWDHGQGWRPPAVVHGIVHPPAGPAQLDPPDIDPFRSSSSASFRSVSNDDSSGDHLFNREIQDALAPLPPLDVIGFDACLMSMVETAYALRGIATVMVGSEELEPATGWNYEKLLERLQADPTMDAEGLGRAVVRAFEDNYVGKSYPTTLSATRLGATQALAERISELADVLRAELSAGAAKVKQARAATPVYAPNTFFDGVDRFQHVDLGRFVEQLLAGSPSQAVRAAAMRVQQALAAAVVEAWAHSARRDPWGSRGLAIYFPVDQATYQADRYELGGYRKDNTLFPVEFVQNQRWADFLHAYLATTVPPQEERHEN